eukprot:gene5939-9769_t
MQTKKEDYLDELLSDDNISHLSNIKKSLIQERFSPEILPYQKESIKFLIDGLEEQEENLINESKNPIVSNLKQFEIERLKYLISTYLRTRIQKIEKYSKYIDENQLHLLSKQEKEFLNQFQENEEAHFSTFLKNIPSSLQSEGNDSLNPNNSKFVFCKVLKNIGEFEIEDEEEILDLKKDKILITKYSSIDELLSDNKVELI